METVGENGSLVTNHAYEQNVYSDSHFIQDYLSGQPLHEEAVTLVADGAYGGEGTVSKAMGHHIKLVTTNFTSKKPADIFADFVFNESGTELSECIHGKHPVRTH